MSSVVEYLQQMGGDDQVAAYKAHHALQAAVFQASAPGNDAKRGAMAAELAQAMMSMTPEKKDDQGKVTEASRPVFSARVRSQAAQLLSYVCGAEQVPQLAAAMKDLDVREMARYALHRNSAPEATVALIDALNNSFGPTFRAGIVATLADKQCPKAIAAVQDATRDDDKKVRMVAAQCLAAIARPENDEIIVSVAKAMKCPKAMKKLTRSRIQLAETLRNAGQKGAAARIYNSVKAANIDAAQTRAAEIGLKAIG